MSKILSFLKKNTLLIELPTLSLIVWLQHRFWIFQNIYKHFSTNMAGGGDAYYNLSLFIQNHINLLNGNFYSLQGDHFTWYNNIIGVTAHNYAPSLVFSFFRIFTENNFLIFNLIYFGNIFLTQIGLYLLVKYYTKNRFLSIFAALLFPLSEAVKTFYVGHIHSSYFWALPFLILLLEHTFDLKNQFLLLSKNSFSKKFNNTSKKESNQTIKTKLVNFFKSIFVFLQDLISNIYQYFKTNSLRKFLVFTLHFLGIFITFGWLIFAEWHVAIFSIIFLAIWFSFKTKFILENFKILGVRLLSISSACLLVFILLLPLGVGYINSSRVFNTTRTIGAVNATNFSIERFYGIGNVLNISGRTLSQTDTAKEIGADEILKEVADIAGRSRPGFPDVIFNISFWIILFVWFFWLFLFIVKKGGFYSVGFRYASIFLIVALIALGPVLKIGSSTIEEILLPHYFIYRVFFPLGAIRAIWRILIVAHISILLFWAIVVNKIYKKLWKNLLEMPEFIKINKFIQSLFLFGLKTMFVLVGMFVLVIVNNGWVGRVSPQIKIESLVDDQSILQNHPKSEIDIFFWGNLEPDKGYFSYLVSKTNYNLLDYNKSLRWVSGGIAGTYPSDANILNNMVSQNKYTDKAVTALAAKKVDLIFQEKRFEPKNEENTDLKERIAKYYTILEENENFVIWGLKDDVGVENITKNLNDIEIFLTLSKYQSTRQDWQMLFNFYNPNQEIYINPDTVVAEDFRIELWQGSTLKDEASFKVGTKALLMPNTGFSVPIEENFRVSPGSYKIKLLKNYDIFYTQDIQVLSSRDYNNKIREHKELELQFKHNQNYPVEILSLHTTTIPILLESEIISGAILNYPQRRPISTNTKISAGFYDAEGGRVTFPTWLFQPQCNLRGNYFAGENIRFVCNQHTPFTKGEYLVKIEVDKDR